ncbi:MAG: NAD(P)H-dependent oxidoreductase subunit E [Kiritimatiellia bacterium]
MVKVTICMGSSCFSRGNSRNLEAVREWLKQNNKEAEVEFKGCRCGGKCSDGPNLWVNEICHCGVTPDAVPALLSAAFGEDYHG